MTNIKACFFYSLLDVYLSLILSPVETDTKSKTLYTFARMLVLVRIIGLSPWKECIMNINLTMVLIERSL